MVSDKSNQIYTDLMEYMRDIYPNVKGGTSYNETKVKLPYIYFFLLDEITGATTLSNTEDAVSLSYQIEVYTDAGMNQTRKMAQDIRTFMIEQGFICRTFTPIQTASNVSRFVGRYERLDV